MHIRLQAICGQVLCAASLVATVLPHTVHAQDKIVMASVVDKDHSYSGRLLYLIYSEAFRRLGMTMEYRLYPAARASAELEAGNVDGELVRASEYGAIHPTMLRVDESVISTPLLAYAHRPEIHVNGWNSLKGSGFRVGYRLGYSVIQAKLEASVPKNSLSPTADALAGLQKLARGRTDLYVDVEENVLPLLATDSVKSMGVRVAGQLERSDLYAYLRPERAELAQRLAQVIREMKGEGAIARFRASAMRPAPLPAGSSR